MYRRRTLILTALACVSVHGNAAAEQINFRFGILRSVADGVFEFVSETRRIPFKTKDTGFRFGVGFDNPQCEAIEWHEVMHLPEETREVSGNFQRAGRKSLRTKTFRSNQASVVDDFWFDEGDPLGKHTLELYVNGVVVFAVDFEVVREK